MKHNENSLEFYEDLDSSSLKTLFPATNIFSFGLINELPRKSFNKEEMLFCYRVIIKAITAFLEEKFSDFDALTATCCCHGIALLFRELALQVKNLNLLDFLSEGEKNLAELERNNSSVHGHFYCNWFLPKPLIELAKLHILTLIREDDANRGVRTVIRKLTEVARLGKNFRTNLVGNLQTYFSNKVAESYQLYLNRINEDINISTLPVSIWGKYIQSDAIREDRRGRKYASNMFSMQVMLAYLLQSKAIVALVNDLRCSKGVIKERYVQLFQGDGNSAFKPIHLQDSDAKEFEPVIVFLGSAYSDDLNQKVLEFFLNPWIDKFPQLILACDTYYPQFPHVGDDPLFDNSPIVPEEDCLKTTISHHSKIKGVSTSDPTLFCLVHIYPTSLKQIIRIIRDEKEPLGQTSFIPEFLKGDNKVPVSGIKENLDVLT